MTRRHGGEGSIDARGPNAWRLRYRVDGKRYSITVHGTRTAAQRELRRLLREGDTGEHVEPRRVTVAQWTSDWLALIRRGQVTARTAERYRELLTTHILPPLGARPLQRLAVTDIDRVYAGLERRLSVATIRHVHVALKACLTVAMRKGWIRKNPCDGATVPRAIDPDCGQALTAAELRQLLDGLRGSALFPIVVTAALTGARLGEVLALRWSDLDPAAKTLRIDRAVEMTREHGVRLKPPKSARGVRTIAIDGALLSVLLAERDRYLRLVSGVPDGANVDLSLVQLPSDALMFPSPASFGDLTRLRNLSHVSREARAQFCRLGFDRLRFHDLRGSHGTALLDAGVPVHVVAARLGHDPAVLLRRYAKRTKQSDESAAAVIGAIARVVL